MKYVRKRNGVEYEGVLYDDKNEQDLVNYWGLVVERPRRNRGRNDNERGGKDELRLVRPGGSVVVTPGTYVLRDPQGIVILQSAEALAADFTAQE